ncbi:lipopolysaccharide biosynthesis protein [Hoylesella timonensis]|uniref:Lipopolysaccharide biosynthesis protein n=1 Tax=Hoylesella timonensis TaxID=386414 RepID=A0A2K0XL58_9BACT|nr:glycoside hydrolase family 99-like domain-containing protein [Hoylesella timonensis]PNP95241.1 lipopolysaccharide biosynthesis protein [Hoylesella timonensis]
MNPRILAFYLPQYYPIPENDEWWGKGFTEWTNVAKAKPLFRGHYQPRIPADLGFYDLRLQEVREAQAAMARDAGVEGFCYYHYWFGNGRQLLERPFNEVLNSGKPDYPFCLCWANHDWTNKTWKKGSSLKTDSIIMKMEYSIDDDIRHFKHLLPAFRDKRYITVDGKPLFGIWAPNSIPDLRGFIQRWRGLALENGLPGLHLVGYTANATGRSIRGNRLSLWATDKAAEHYQALLDQGLDAVISSGLSRGQAMCQGRMKMLAYFLSKHTIFPINNRTDYKKTMENYYVEEDRWENVYPTLMPQWDRTPRAGIKTNPLTNSTPEKFEKTIDTALSLIKDKQPEHQILFLKSWNEWGEGNYVEPDLKFGHGYLDAIRNAINKARKE